MRIIYERDGLRLAADLIALPDEPASGYNDIESLAITEVWGIDGRWHEVDRDNPSIAAMADLLAEAESDRLQEKPEYLSWVLDHQFRRSAPPLRRDYGSIRLWREVVEKGDVQHAKAS